LYHVSDDYMPGNFQDSTSSIEEILPIHKETISRSCNLACFHDRPIDLTARELVA
jgi:hypothetical protein